MFLLSRRHRLLFGRQAGDLNVTWIAPTMNNTLRAGQDFVAKWSAPTPPISPSFQLCMEPMGATNGNDTGVTNCGSSVAVPLQEAQGVYFVSLAIPNITSPDPFFLRIHDESGFAFDSPPFFIQLPSTNASDVNSTNGVSTKNSQTNFTTPGLAFKLHNVAQGPGDARPTLSQLEIPSAFAKRDSLNFPFAVNAPMLTTLAIIPLLMVTAGLAIAVFFWFRQRRNAQLKRLYLTEARMIYPRRPSPKTLNSAEDIESAVQSLSQQRLTGKMRPEGQGYPEIQERFDIASRKKSTIRHKKGPSKRQLLSNDNGWKSPSSIPLPSSSDSGSSTSSRTSYEPTPRCLTDSYFPSLQGPIEQSFMPENAIIECPTSIGPSPGGGGHVPSPRSAALATTASPPPPSVAKLSERLHLRTLSNSASSRAFGRPVVAG